MHDEIHVVVDSLSAADETALKDDPRCHILRLIIRHGDLEWQDGDRSLAELFGMVEATIAMHYVFESPKKQPASFLLLLSRLLVL